MKTNRLTTRLLPLLAAFALLGSAHAQNTAVPDYLSYQGRALNADGTTIGSGTPVNRTVTFRVWDHPSNSLVANLIYSEQQVVTISNGEFSALIGAGAATTGTALGYSETSKGVPTVKISSPTVFGAATRYLGVTIDDGTAAVDNEISPRQQFVTSSYAFRAKVAESVEANAISSGMLATGAVGSTQLAAASVTNAKLGTDAVLTTNIGNLNVTTAKLADLNVTTGKIADANVTTAKIADLNVTTAKLADASVTGIKIASATIAAANLATGAVTSTAILDGTIATADMANSAVTSAKLADGSVVTADLADNSVTSAKIVNATVTGADIAAGTITDANLGTNTATTVENLRIVRGTITAASGTVAGNIGVLTGLVATGSGYSYVLNTAFIQITFNPPFSAPPTILVSNCSYSGWEQYVVRGGSDFPTASQFKTSCSLSGVSQAGDTLYSGHGNGLQFIAIGPR
jgi:uncharacterized protein YjbI with pentapeptide repeats